MNDTLIAEIDPGANKIWVESPTWYGWLVKDPKGWFARLGETRFDCHGFGISTCYRYGNEINYKSIDQEANQFHAYHGKLLPGYEELGSLAVSLDGQQYAFPGFSNGVWVLHHNGREIARGDGVKHVCFSPDSKRLVYTLKVGNFWAPGESGRDGESYYKILSGDDIGCPEFSSDSRYWAFVGQKKRGDGVSLFLNQKLVTIPGEDARNWVCTAWCFSDAGSRWATLFAPKKKGGTRKRDDCIFMVDGVVLSKQSPWMDWHCLCPQAGPFSPDGSCLAYPIKEEKNFFIVQGERKFGPYEKIGSKINWLPKTNKAVWAAKDKIGWRIYLDGEPDTDRSFAQIEDRYIYFSPDGNNYAYIAATSAKKETLLIKNGSVINRSVASFPLLAQFSVKGKLAYPVYDVDEKIGVGVDDEVLVTGQDRVVRIYWSGQGNRIGCECERNQKSYIYVDGVIYGPFDQIESFEFSADEAHWAVGVRSEANTLLLLDGGVVDRMDQLLVDKRTDRLFADNGATIQYYCVANNKLYWRSQAI